MGWNIITARLQKRGGRPEGRPPRCFLLDVNVVVDVLRTVAVIAVALGAVTKFLVGVVGVGLAADGALVDIALLLLGLLGGLLEVDGLAGGLVFDPAEELEEIVPGMMTPGRAARPEVKTPKRLLRTLQPNRAASIHASHLILMGMMKKRSTCMFGYRVAKAKNRERFT